MFRKIQNAHSIAIMGFLGRFSGSPINAHSFIKLSPPSMRSISRGLNGLLAKTLHRSTFAISLNTSRKLRPRARFKIVMIVLN